MSKHAKPGYIYFMRSGSTDKYKIGLSVDPDRRLKELNSEQACEPIEKLWDIRVSNMFVAESWLHQSFSNNRYHGEWFHFADSDIEAVKTAYGQAQQQWQYATERPRLKPVYHRLRGDSVYAPRVIHKEPTSSGGWGIAVTLIVAIIGFFVWPYLPQLSEMTSNSRIVTIDYKSGRVNIRKSPNGPIVRTIGDGETVSLTGKKQGEWHQTINNQWIHRSTFK